MTPVILLSEGFLGNGSEPWRIPSMSEYPEIKAPVVQGMLQEGEKFRPFDRDPETLVRSWAVPGQKGFEHRVGGLEKNHAGVLSSDPLNHELMVNERAEKVARIANYIPVLEVDGPESGKLLVVGWGGTYGHIKSAVEQVREEGDKVSFAHFDFINPLPRNTREVFEKFDKIIVCELNSGQFAAYLRARLPENKYIQCNKIQAQPFLVNEVVDAIKKEL